MFALLRGAFQCLRCRVESYAAIQTHLFEVTAWNASQTYLVGDEAKLDMEGLGYPLRPWDGEEHLRLIVGDWDCSHCLLNFQWAKVTVSVRRNISEMLGRIVSLETFLPLRQEAFDDVHWIEEELVEAAFRDGDLTPEDRKNWTSLPLDERSVAICRFFNRWCVTIADADPQTLLTNGGGGRS